METHASQHWIVTVARATGLPGADALNIPPDTAVGAAWDAAARRLDIGGDALAGRVAAYYRLPLAELAVAEAPTFRLFPAALARGLGVLPLRCTDRSISVATADPVSPAIERQIAEVTGRDVRREIASPAALTAALDRAYPGPAEPSVDEVPPRPESGAARILVVDDDADSRALMRSVLEERGFRVTEAPDGPEALETLGRGDPFDLVTLDLQMAKMPGLELLRHLRSHLATAGVPVVVATGAEDPAMAAALFEAGADDFVVKPVDGPRFVLRVQAVLRRRALPRRGF